MAPLAFGRRSLVALLPVPALAQSPGLNAGLLVVGQVPAQAYAEGGGLRAIREGLAGLLGLPAPRFEPGPGLRRAEAYALPAGLVRDPPAFTTSAAPLWEPGNPRGILLPRLEDDPLTWPRGAAGQALGRFVRSVMTAEDRARCLGILWLPTLAEAPAISRSEIFTHVQAMRRHLMLIRADFGRPASGPDGLPAFLWTPAPLAPPAEEHRWLRQAIAELATDSEMNARVVMPQTSDIGPRDLSVAATLEPVDLVTLGRRAAYAIGRELGAPVRFPGPGPRIIGVEATNPVTTEVLIAFDRGSTIQLNGMAADGRGWSVNALGEDRKVHSVQRAGPARLLLRHQVAAPRRTIGYCLFGERIGRDNGITDDWGTRGELPPGLPRDWLFDMPLQATLTPWYSG